MNSFHPRYARRKTLPCVSRFVQRCNKRHDRVSGAATEGSGANLIALLGLVKTSQGINASILFAQTLVEHCKPKSFVKGFQFVENLAGQLD